MSFEFLQHLYNMPYAAQLRHWSGPKPWDHDGKATRPRGTPSVTVRDVTVDVQGNIRRMPPVLNRPCFGNPIAYLMHTVRLYRTIHDGKIVKTRCARCPAQEGCVLVAKARLRCSDDIRMAWEAWEAAGGRPAMDDLQRHPVASHRWRDLLSTLRTHGPFESVNDARVRDYLETEQARKRKADSTRKLKERAKARAAAAAAGAFDDEFLDRLEREVIFRSGRLRDARATGFIHKKISQILDAEIAFTANTWRATVLLTLQNRPINPNRVAAELIRRKLVTTSNQNALRQRVLPALERIDLLERTTFPGGLSTIWPKVAAREVFEDEDFFLPT